MNSPKKTAIEGFLSSAEHWKPGDSELWGAWRGTLSEDQRSNVLFPLQALLSGVVAYRQPEHQEASRSRSDFRPRLRAVHASYAWALDLVARLHGLGRDETATRSDDTLDRGGGQPSASLRDLEQSLCDALRVSEHLLDLPLVDAGAFEAGMDFFLRELEHNKFFHPPDPLEFSNVEELVRSDFIARDLDFWKSGAATMVAFLTLLRAHRFLGIAERQREAVDGAEREEVLAAGIRRELSALRLFLSLQGLDPVAKKLEDLDLRSCAEARGRLKLTAKALRSGPEAEPRVRKSERVPKNRQQEIWAFRFILRAFLAKASAMSGDVGDQSFAQEFARHFRTFAPKLMRVTEYPYPRPLTAAVSALNRRAGADRQAIEIAVAESERFVEYLDATLDLPSLAHGGFDKQKAAEELRSYLESASARSADRRAAAAAFGLIDPNAQAS